MLISGEGYSSILSSEYPLLGTKPFPALKGHYYCTPNNGNAPNFLPLWGLMCSSSENTTLTSEGTEVWAVNMKIPQKIHSFTKGQSRLQIKLTWKVIQNL